MSFEKALQFTLKAEGGYVNDPADSGGATNKGITQRTYNSFREEKPFNAVKNITNEEVKTIYRNEYWNTSHCDNLPDELAIAVFDTAVNCGVSRAIKILQSRLDIKADGVFGAITKESVKNIPDLKDFVSKYLNERSAFYQRWVQINPGKAKFLGGLLRRVENLKEFLYT